MPAVREARTPINDELGAGRGYLRVALLPGDNPGLPPLMDLTNDAERDPALEPIQLLEDWEYLYEIELPATDGVVETDRPEVLFPDAQGGSRGRLRTRSRTGLLPVQVILDGRVVGTSFLEVRSRKLNYLAQYRWMLRDLAETATGILLERFAPTQLRVVPLETVDAETAYERFVLIQSIVDDPTVEAAFQYILARPHTDWRTEQEFRPPTRGLPKTSGIRKQLISPGPRVPWPASPLPALPSAPKTIAYQRSEETLDTPPNQFVKFVVARWIGIISAIRGSLETLTDSAPRSRGIRESQKLADKLTAMLSEPIFAEVGELRHFPASNQVLQKREGYRDFLSAYVQVEGSLQISWHGGEAVFAAGQRNVATLYEFWAYLQVLRALEPLCTTFDKSPLVHLVDDQANLSLQRGRESMAKGTAERLGRSLDVEVIFNRRFVRSSDRSSSWTMPMQPDCSIRIAPQTKVGLHEEDVWLHYDAKYRIDHLSQVLGAEQPDQDSGTSRHSVEDDGEAKRDDLLKMHAYRDAIRRSAGSFVLYPGGRSETAEPPFRQYSEILPGLGAFALRPTETGEPQGESALRTFLDDVLTHFASVITQHRRGRFWDETSFGLGTRVSSRTGLETGSAKPPADTLVLLGYVRSSKQLHWIRTNLRYNLRAGARRGSVGLNGRELAADVVALYGQPLPTPEFWLVRGAPEIWQRQSLVESGYPRPGGDLYFCLPLGDRLEFPAPFVTTARLDEVRTRIVPNAAVGHPVVTTWLELVR